MNPGENEFIASRLALWKAISEFYLDTELQKNDYDNIFNVFIGSGKSLEELKQIDLYEVFPTFQHNLLSIAGEWSGFEEKWLSEECYENYLKRNNCWFKLKVKLKNRSLYWTRKEQWEEISLRLKNSG